MKPARPKYELEFLYSSFPERDEAEWYKWEFLRRNARYRADYEQFKKTHGPWLRRNGYWYDYTKRPGWTECDEEHFYTKIAPEIVRLCVKWQVGDLHPPHWQFKKVRDGHVKEERPLAPATGFTPELNWDRRFVKELLELGFTGRGGMARRYGHLVLVEFDLKWPLRDLLDFARRVLARAQGNYKDGLQERGDHFPVSRRRFEDYKSHLRVWDLKRKGKTVTEIANAVFPNDHSSSVLQKVRDHLKAAERLISGYYKEIR